ncbi:MULTISPECIES: hypothetical protein [unclassified Pseudomonas]|uniref:hypothetical protein n=1 Tax=unclassified Pseudomonas TaxID=196821 RepID=UPI00235EF382|nr:MULTISPECIES: hypothetical protein [unclassified Pseudomonas]
MNSGTDETLLEMAREWAREQDPAFHRFFDISTEDTAWLKAATDRDQPAARFVSDWPNCSIIQTMR